MPDVVTRADAPTVTVTPVNRHRHPGVTRTGLTTDGTDADAARAGELTPRRSVTSDAGASHGGRHPDPRRRHPVTKEDPTMTVTTVTVTDAATDAAVIDGARVHRDWRQIGAEASGVTTAVTAAVALTASVLHLSVTLAWTAATACAISTAVLAVMLTLTQREGRRWTYATDADTH